VNLTDTGEGVIVNEALTNPTVLAPIGNLSPGRYMVEVHVSRFILRVTYDASSNPITTAELTVAEEIWTKTFDVT